MMGRCLAALILIAALAGLRLSAAPRDASVPRVAGAPTIDGDLSDTCWREAPCLSPFVSFNADTPAEQRTTLKLATDGKWLFAAFDCEDPDLKALPPRTYRIDAALSRVDSVEIFLDPDASGQDYLQFKVAANGDQSVKRRRNADGVWRDLPFSAHWRSAGKLTERGYAAEVAIPLFYFQRLMTAKTTGDEWTWKANFCRNHCKTGESQVSYSCWAPTSRSFQDAACFGTVRLPAGAGEVFAPVLVGMAPGVFSDADGTHKISARFNARDDGDVGGEVVIALRDRDLTGKNYVEEKRLTLDKRGEKSERLNIVFRSQATPNPTLSLSLRDALGTWEQSAVGKTGEVSDALTAFVERNYYTTEKTLKVWCSVPAAATRAAGLTLIVSLGGVEKKLSPAPGLNAVEFDIAARRPGTWTGEARLTDASGVTLDKAPLTATRLPPNAAGNEVKIDRYDRSVLVNGKPFFPFGFVDSEASPPSLLKALDMNALYRWMTPYESARKADVSISAAVANDATLKAAEALGLMTIEAPIRIRGGVRFQRNDFVTRFEHWYRRDLPEALAAFKARPNLLGYLCMDEPSDRKVYPGGGELLDYLARYMKTVRKLDPYHPIFNNFSHAVPANPRWTEDSDILSVYAYWVAHVVRGEQYDAYVKAIGESARKENKPVFMMLMNESAYSMARLSVSPEEQRAQTYLALVRGARGIFYFFGPSMCRGSFDMLKRLGEEIKALSPALLRREPEQRWELAKAAETSAVAGSLRVAPDGVPTLLLVNKRDCPVDIRIELPWLSPTVSRVESVFDAATTVPVREKAFSETLGPLATRAYRLPGATIDDLNVVRRILVTETPRDGETRASINLAFETDSDWRAEDGSAMVYELSRDGKRCLRLSRAATDIGPKRVTRSGIYLSPDRNYSLSCRLRYDLSEWKRHEKRRSQDYCGASLWLSPVSPKNGFAARAFAPYVRTKEWQSFQQTISVGPSPVEAKIVLSLNDCVGDAWFEDIRLVDIGPVYGDLRADSSRNLLPNSSFEYARMTGWPDRWTVFRFNPLEKGFVGEEKSPWGQDMTASYHGRFCLKLGAELPWFGMTNAPYARRFNDISLALGQPYVFSVYMKSDRDKVPVDVSLRNIGERRFWVDATWKRYAFSGPFKPVAAGDGTGVRVCRPQPAEGTVWLDAAQLEKGETPTEYVPDSYVPQYPFK